MGGAQLLKPSFSGANNRPDSRTVRFVGRQLINDVQIPVALNADPAKEKKRTPTDIFGKPTCSTEWAGVRIQSF